MKRILLLATVVALLTGCGPMLSLHPLYTNQDLVSEPAIEGQWTDQDNELWMVRKVEDGYRVTHPPSRSSEQPDKYDLHLLRLGDVTFLDITAADEPDLTIAGHLFAKVWTEGPDLRMVLLTSDWLQEQVVKSGWPAHVKRGDRVVLTATTEDLQKFVLKYAAEPRAFGDVAALHRVR